MQNELEFFDNRFSTNPNDLPSRKAVFRKGVQSDIEVFTQFNSHDVTKVVLDREQVLTLKEFLRDID